MSLLLFALLCKIGVMDEMLYFSWESGPAVVTPEVDNSVFGFFISPEASEWEMATPLQISDFFIDGS